MRVSRTWCCRLPSSARTQRNERAEHKTESKIEYKAKHWQEYRENASIFPKWNMGYVRDVKALIVRQPTIKHTITPDNWYADCCGTFSLLFAQNWPHVRFNKRQNRLLTEIMTHRRSHVETSFDRREFYRDTQCARLTVGKIRPRIRIVNQFYLHAFSAIDVKGDSVRSHLRQIYRGGKHASLEQPIACSNQNFCIDQITMEK